VELLSENNFNTGILLRCEPAPAAAKVRLNGYQVKIDPTTRAWTGGIFDDYGADWKWLHDLKGDARARGAFRMGEWSRFRIECLGQTIKVWVNDVPVTHLIDERYRIGTIAFKIHSIGDNPEAGRDALRLRNVRILSTDLERHARPIPLAARRAPPVPDPADGDILLPPGFRATIVADNLMAGRKGDTLRFLALEAKPNSDLYAISRKGGIFALRDTDGDGRADLIREFGSGGGSGLAVRNGYLYYSSASAVYRYKLTPGELVPSGPPELIAQLPDQTAHNAKAFAFDPAGNLFVNVGSPLNVSALNDRTPGAKGIDPTELQQRQGGIWRFKGDIPNQDQTRDGYRYATGLRHVLSLAWHPVKQAFFVVQMGRDQLDTVAPRYYTAHDNAELPAEEMHLLRDQGELGWPTTYWDPLRRQRMLAPEFGGDGRLTAEPGRFPDPVVAFPAHWAPMQMAINITQHFPNHYLNGAFVAFHGSWNRGPEPQRGYVVAFVPFGPDGMPRGQYEVFADGFAGVDPLLRPADARFRPAGLAFGFDGTLYVGDSEKGRIWRISYTGERAAPRQAPARPGGAPTAPAPVLSPEEARNAAAYKLYCAACHMDDGSGVSGMQPAIAGSEIVSGDPDRLIRLVLAGPAAVLPTDRPKYSNLMPPWEGLPDADIAAALTHARRAFAQNAGEITAAQVAAVRARQDRSATGVPSEAK
jgi:glucose/arabinose dehydrogenase/mono/diheme cytochrome c family protein